MITAPAINPGRLDRRITLLSPTETREAGGSGGVSVSYASAGDVWAQFNPQTGRELLSADQRTAQAQAVFRIRHRSDVTAKWRLTAGGVTWEIIAPPVEVGRREYLDLVCTALNP